jgi:hypothetical protein
MMPSIFISPLSILYKTTEAKPRMMTEITSATSVAISMGEIEVVHNIASCQRRAVPGAEYRISLPLR